MAVRDLLLTGPALDRDRLQRTVLRAHKWEHRADELVVRCRSSVPGGGESRPILDLMSRVDDIADAVEEAIYRTSLRLPNASLATCPTASQVAQAARPRPDASEGHSGRVHAGRVEVVVEWPTPSPQEVGRWKACRREGLAPSLSRSWRLQGRGSPGPPRRRATAARRGATTARYAGRPAFPLRGWANRAEVLAIRCPPSW
jgi:hypothetical protein